MSERFESTDLQSGVVARVGAWLAVTVLLVFVVAYVLLHVLKSHAPAVGGRGIEPPAPRLQLSAPLDLANLRAREEADLTTYRWLNRQGQTIAIPINRAIDLTVERGLPARPKP